VHLTPVDNPSPLSASLGQHHNIQFPLAMELNQSFRLSPFSRPVMHSFFTLLARDVELLLSILSSIDVGLFYHFLGGGTASYLS